MSVVIYEPWLWNLYRCILLILSVFIQDVSAATEISEVGGVIAAGIIGLSLLISVIVALVYFCKRLKSNRRENIENIHKMNTLRKSAYKTYGMDRTAPPTVSTLAPPMLHRLPNTDTELLPIPRYTPEYNVFNSSRFQNPYDFHRNQNKTNIPHYNMESNMKPMILETTASIHETSDFSVINQGDTVNFAPNSVESQFILRKQEENLPRLNGGNPMENETLSVTDFMLNRKSQHSYERSDLRYATNDNSSNYPMNNGGRFLTVGYPSQKDTHPNPDYEHVITRNEIENQETFRNSRNSNFEDLDFDFDLQEIKKNFPSDDIQNSYRVNWDESYYKQVQFNSNPENIVISNVSLR